MRQHAIHVGMMHDVRDPSHLGVEQVELVEQHLQWRPAPAGGTGRDVSRRKVEVAVDGRRQIIPRRPLDQVQLERSRGQAVEAGKDLRSNGQLDPLDSDDDLGWYAPADGADLVPQRLEAVIEAFQQLGAVFQAAPRR